MESEEESGSAVVWNFLPGIWELFGLWTRPVEDPELRRRERSRMGAWTLEFASPWDPVDPDHSRGRLCYMCYMIQHPGSVRVCIIPERNSFWSRKWGVGDASPTGVADNLAAISNWTN